MTRIICLLYLINIFKSLAADTNVACPLQECTCNLVTNSLECDTRSVDATLAFRNKNLNAYSTLLLSNLNRLNSDSFANTQFASQLDLLSISHIKLIESNSWSWSIAGTSIKQLQLTFSDDLIIEPSAFDYLRCDTLALTCVACNNNHVINLNAFGESTDIKHLLLDYEERHINVDGSPLNLIFRNQINLFNKMSVEDQPFDEYWPTWYTVARIEHVGVNNVRGIFTLDYKFIPNFRGLNLFLLSYIY